MPRQWFVACTFLCIQPGPSLGSPVPSKHKLVSEAGWLASCFVLERLCLSMFPPVMMSEEMRKKSH